MEYLAMILAVAIGTYLIRIAGFTLDRKVIPRHVDRALTFVPVAAFAALLTPGLSDDGGGLDPVRVAAAILAALAVLLTRRLWAALLAGMALFWLWPLAV